VGDRSLFYRAFDSAEDAGQSLDALNEVLND
jgi:hypothetical protein